jgi:hypothetical protein
MIQDRDALTALASAWHGPLDCARVAALGRTKDALHELREMA